MPVCLLYRLYGVVAAPRALDPRWASRLRRFHGRGWAVVPIASIVGVIFMIRYASRAPLPGSPILRWSPVPLLSIALALGWLARGSAPLVCLALVAAGLFVLAWRLPGSLGGEALPRRCSQASAASRSACCWAQP